MDRLVLFACLGTTFALKFQLEKSEGKFSLEDEDINLAQEFSYAIDASRTLDSGAFSPQPKIDEYFIKAKIGTPPQEFGLLLEFSEKESIIYDNSCQGICPKTFNRSASNTFKELSKKIEDKDTWIRGTDIFSLENDLDVQGFEFVTEKIKLHCTG